MQLADLKRPRVFVPVGLFLLLASVTAVVFHPAFQKKMLLEHVGPLVDSLEIERIHFTPWSLELANVAVDYAGGHFKVGNGSIRYCLSSLLLLQLNIKQLLLQEVKIDVANFNPPPSAPAEDGIFPGVLASLDHGLGYSLQELKVGAEVSLPGKQLLAANITGGGIRPGQKGDIRMAVRFNTGKAEDHILVDGVLALDQLSRGRFAAIETELDVQAVLADLPETERVGLKLAVTPAALDREQLAVITDGEVPRYSQEFLQLTLQQHDADDNDRAVLELGGTYDGNSGDFAGAYRFTANERLVQPYVGDKVVPPTKEALTGAVDINVANLTGDITVISDLLVTGLRETQANDKLPEMLRLENNFRLSLLPGRQLRIVTLDAGVFDEAENQPLSASVPADLDIPLDNIDAFLQQENTLLEFELPGVPLAWFDVFLPGQEITGGRLTAAFKITTDTSSTIHLKPVKPVKITGLTVLQEGAVLVDGVNLSVMPEISYSTDTAHVSLEQIVITATEGTLAKAAVNATLPLSGDRQGAVDAHASADLDVYNLLAYLDIKKSGRYGVPRHFSVDFAASARQKPGSVVINRLDGNLFKDGKTRLVKLALQQPLVLNTSGEGKPVANAAGQLAQLNISDIRLSWFSAFVPDASLRGRLQRADFTLAMDDSDIASLTTDRPIRLRNVTVTGKDGPLLENVEVSLWPEIRLLPEGTQISYRDLGVSSDGSSLISGSGKLILPATAVQSLVADGRLDIDIQALARQPVVADALQAGVTAPVRLEADYQLAQGESSIDISRLAVNLFYADGAPHVSLTADSNVRVRTRLRRNQSEVGRARGKVTLAVAGLTPGPFADILKARGLGFSEANGNAVLSSDGKSLTIDSIEPFIVTGIGISGEDGVLLQPFTLKADANAVLTGDTLQAKLDPFSLTFDRHKDAPAVDAKLDLSLTGGDGMARVQDLTADLSMSLPAMLDQPAILPGHTLKAGRLDTRIRIDPDGKLTSLTRIHDLQGSKPLMLELLALQVDGRLEPDGSFNISAPLRTVGNSGSSDMLLEAVHSKRNGANDDLSVNIDSSVFYLNDILNTLNAVAGRQESGKAAKKSTATDEEQAAAAAAEEALELLPDKRAFWDVIPYDRHVSYQIGKLYYTDYLVIHAIRGRTEITPERLAVEDFEAHFHDSPIRLAAAMTFTPGDLPYDLNLQAGVEQFDLARFFRELVPDSKPRAEGLFNVSLEASGQSPNIPQYRNHLLFDMRLQSRKGVFRLLDPNSPLVGGTTGFAGAIGEGVSYLPTGLFGLGAVSRLVEYLKEVDYDKAEARLVRDETRNVQIKRYVVQNPEILMTATGGIEYQEGVDILHSPLAMNASLNFREKGAAIMYDLDLLKSKQDAYGYWKGPKIKFWGVPVAMESNLGDIITTAGNAAILGGITRPISGLIGNIRHRWMDEDTEAKEYTE
jgi:hypothetical protein